MVPDGTFGIVGVFVTDERSVDRGAWLGGGAMATWRHVGRGFTDSIRCMPVVFARRRLNRLTFLAFYRSPLPLACRGAPVLLPPLPTHAER